VLLREPARSKVTQVPKADQARLQKLFAAVAATPIGQKFLALAKGKPKVVWGDTGGYNGQFDGDSTIILNEEKESTFNDCQWQQVIAMELGNFANATLFDPIFDSGVKGNLSEDEFVSAIETIEFDSRNLVLEAHTSGQFGTPDANCPSIFPGGRIAFEDYMKASGTAAHRALYSDKWKRECRKNYVKLHPDESPAKKQH
jgi:hypothetical protein